MKHCREKFEFLQQVFLRTLDLAEKDRVLDHAANGRGCSGYKYQWISRGKLQTQSLALFQGWR